MRVYLTVLATAVLLVLGFFSTGLGGEILSEKISLGQLSVTTVPPDLLITVDGETIGKTPLSGVSLPVGDHLLEIENWQEKISVAADQTTFVHREISSRTAQSAYGYSITHQPLSTFLFDQTQLVVDATPASSEVSIDQQLALTTPFLLESIAPGGHHVTVQQKGYSGYDFTVPTYSNTLTRVSVRMRPDLLAGLVRLNLRPDDLVNIDTATVPPIISRLAWGGSYDFLRDQEVQTAPWQTLAVWTTPVTERLDLTHLLLELSLIELNSTSAELSPKGAANLPFAYIVDHTGRIYEGVGIYDFDFSQLDPVSKETDPPLQFDPGVAPVLVLTVGDNPPLGNSSTKSSLAYLQNFLRQEVPLAAEPVTQVGTLQLAFGEHRTFDLQWRNLSPVIWQKTDALSIWLTTTNPDPSRLYDPPTWKSPQIVVTFNEDRVLPGEVATFTLPLRAGYYPTQVREEFVLQNQITGKNIDRSPLVINAEIKGESDQTLEVLPTPTGSLNVRISPGHSQDLVSAVYTGDRFAWIKEETNWVEIIMSNGERGWVESRYIKKLQ